MADYGFLDTSVNQIVDNSLSNLKFNKAAALTSGSKEAKTREEIAKTSEDFEAVFMTMMTKFMFEGVEVDPIMGGGSAEETYRTLLFDEYGKTMAKAGGIGVSDMVQAQLLQQQGLEPLK